MKHRDIILISMQVANVYLTVTKTKLFLKLC